MNFLNKFHCGKNQYDSWDHTFDTCRQAKDSLRRWSVFPEYTLDGMWLRALKFSMADCSGKQSYFWTMVSFVCWKYLFYKRVMYVDDHQMKTSHRTQMTKPFGFLLLVNYVCQNYALEQFNTTIKTQNKCTSKN